MNILIFKGSKLNIRIEAPNLNDKELRLINNAIGILGQIVNSKEFENFILNYTWEKTYYKRKWFRKVLYKKKGNDFRWNNELTKKQILNKIMTGAEILDPMPDKEIDIFLKVDRRNRRSVIGYTYSSVKWQWIYSWVLRKYDVYDVAANLLHEWAHCIGFGHERRYNPLREFTVPYALGRFVSKQNPLPLKNN